MIELCALQPQKIDYLRTPRSDTCEPVSEQRYCWLEQKPLITIARLLRIRDWPIDKAAALGKLHRHPCSAHPA